MLNLSNHVFGKSYFALRNCNSRRCIDILTYRTGLETSHVICITRTYLWRPLRVTLFVSDLSWRRGEKTLDFLKVTS